MQHRCTRFKNGFRILAHDNKLKILNKTTSTTKYYATKNIHTKQNSIYKANVKKKNRKKNIM